MDAKKMVAIMLCLILLVSIFSACTASKNEATEGDITQSMTESTEGDEDEQPEERLTLKIYEVQLDSGVNPEGEVVKEMEKRLDVNIELIPRKDAEAFSAQIASGDIPDYIPDGIPVNMINVWISQGVIAELSEEMIAENAPRYMAWLHKWLGDDPFIYGRRNGKNYYMPVVWSLGPQNRVVGIRNDWRKAVNIEVPKTIDEFEQLLTAFVKDDPDGNGQNDTYGITSYDYYGVSAVWGAFGVYPSIFYEENGEIVYGDVQPKAKEALTVLNRWYKEGLIDPEFMVNNGSSVTEKWVAEKVGSLVSGWSNFIPGDAFWGGTYYEKLLEKNGTVDLMILDPLTGPNGEAGCLQINPNRGGVVYGKQLEDQPELMKKYLEYWEYTSFYKEGLDLRMKGIEGITYTYSEEKGYEWIPPFDKLEEREKYGILFAATHFNDYDMQAPYMTKPEYMDIRKEAESKGTGKYDILEQIERPVFAQYKEQLEAFTQKNIIDFITGARPLDQFDQFVQEWYDMGGSQVMDEAQQKYEEFFINK